MADIEMKTPMVDRGVDIIPHDDLHAHMSGILAPMELVLAMLFPILIWGVVKYDIYKEFPYSLYRWSICLDWLYGLTMGPFRWLSGNPFYDSMAWPGTSGGCDAAVFLDTFCQIGFLYTNTLIVATVFYAVYFRENFNASKDKYENRAWQGLMFSTIFISAAITLLSDVHNYVGWCTADSISVIFKQLCWFLCVVMQITMMIPTCWIVWKSSKRTRIGSGAFIRFMGIMFSQFIGLFPILTVEFLGLARKSVPSWIMWAVIVLFPVAHFCDFLLLSIKMWPSVLTYLDTAGHCNWVKEFNMDVVERESEVEKGGSQVAAMDANRTGGSEKSYSAGSSDNDGSMNSDDMGSQNESDGSYDDYADSQGSEGTDYTGFSGTADSTSVVSGMSGNSNAWKQYEKSRQSGSTFEKIPFWLHLSITIFIPFCLLACVSLIMVFAYDSQVSASNEIRKDIKLGSKMSNFVHESQKERGATGVFLGSKGDKFQCEIVAQYILTSFHKNALQYYLDFEFANVRLVTKSTFLHALIGMLGIEAHRAKVQVLTITKVAGINYYTNMNMYFIGIVAEICRDSKLGSTIQHKLFSNLAFFMAKEQAGIERAKGTGPFSAETMEDFGSSCTTTCDGPGEKEAKIMSDSTKYRTFIEVISRQDTFIYFYEIYVEGADRQFYIETMDDVSVQNCAVMRGILVDANASRLIAGSSQEWFDNMTAKINLVREVEAALANLLTINAADIVSASTEGIMIVVGTLALVLIIDGLMILGLARTSNALKNFSVGQKRKRRRQANFISNIYTMLVDMNFTYQVLVSVLGSGIGLIIVSWMLLQQQVMESQSSSATLDNMYLQYYLSNYIHEVQKERGATGVFMGSMGKRFGENLGAQKNLTNVHRSEFFRFQLEYVDFEDLYSHSAWTTLRIYIDGFAEHRTKSFTPTEKCTVDGELIYCYTAAQSLGYYTRHNGHIVGMFREIARRAADGSIESRLLAYLGFIYMKEKAGNERAVGSVGFSSDSWGGNANFQKFISLVAIQDAAKQFFDTFGSLEQKEQFVIAGTVKGSRIATEMRAKGMSNDEEQMATVDGGQWYGNITEKIDEWRKVEERIADDLEVYFLSLDQTAETFIIGVIVMLSLLFLICVFVIQKGIRLLLNSRAYMMYQERLRDARSKQKSSVKTDVKEEKTTEKTVAAPVAV